MSKSVRKSLETFIAQCKEKHGDTYDYSESEYLGSYTKIEIKCRIHGKFWQWPNDHRHGRGCPQCAKNKVVPENFLKEMDSKYPTYDFSNFVYKGAKSKSIVICPDHGEFLARPNDLNYGHACPKCGMNKQQETKIKNGIVTDPKDKPEYENYRREVWKISNRNYRLHKDIINPQDLPRNLKYHLDHIYPIQKGWINNVPASVIGAIENLQILEGVSNRKKGTTIPV